MPKKPADPNAPKSIRRPKAAPEPTQTPPDDEAPAIAEMTDALAAIVATIPDDVRVLVTQLVAANKHLTACRKFQDAAADSGAPELSRPEQRACCLAIAQAYVAPEGTEPFVADDSGGEDDSYDPKPVAPAPRRTGKVVLGKRKLDREVPINDVQFVEFSRALAQCEKANRDLKLAHHAVRAKMKQEKDDAEANRARLADIIDRGVEVRGCTVVLEADYDLSVVREIDEATGDVLETRPLKPEEYQVPLIPQAMLNEVQPETEDTGPAEGERALEVIEGGKEDDGTDPEDEDGNDEDVE